MKYYPAQICLNGHIITENATIPKNCKEICPKCNEPTITKCPDCKANILGMAISGNAYGFYDKNKPPSHCHKCKQPYPWTKSDEKFKIARFIDLSACKNIFSDYGTFVLRSPQHYRNIEDEQKRDKAEGYIEHKDEHGRIGHSERMCYLISCWTKLGGDVPSCDEWKIFGEDHIMALISTPEKVKNCIEKKLITVKPDNVRSLCWRVDHKEVVYYEKGTYQDQNKVFDGFHKDIFFSEQNEYRFVVSVRGYIDTLMFYAEPEDYCDTAIINTKTLKCLELYKAYEDGKIEPGRAQFIENFKELARLVARFPCTFSR